MMTWRCGRVSKPSVTCLCALTVSGFLQRRCRRRLLSSSNSRLPARPVRHSLSTAVSTGVGKRSVQLGRQLLYQALLSTMTWRCAGDAPSRLADLEWYQHQYRTQIGHRRLSAQCLATAMVVQSSTSTRRSHAIMEMLLQVPRSGFSSHRLACSTCHINHPVDP